MVSAGTFRQGNVSPSVKETTRITGAVIRRLPASVTAPASAKESAMIRGFDMNSSSQPTETVPRMTPTPPAPRIRP